MKNIIICIAALFLLGAGWVEGTYMGVPTDNSKKPIALFVSTETSQTIPDIPIPPNQWVTIDLPLSVPYDAVAVFISGQAIITYPSGGTMICNLWATFRAPGDSLPAGAYQVQTIEATPSAGQRSNAALWVPVVDRKFEVYWFHTPGCPSALNFSLQAYVR